MSLLVFCLASEDSHVFEFSECGEFDKLMINVKMKIMSLFYLLVVFVVNELLCNGFASSDGIHLWQLDKVAAKIWSIHHSECQQKTENLGLAIILSSRSPPWRLDAFSLCCDVYDMMIGIMVVHNFRI